MVSNTMNIYGDNVINHQNSSSYQFVMGPTRFIKTSYYVFDQTISSQFQYFLLPGIGKTEIVIIHVMMNSKELENIKDI